MLDAPVHTALFELREHGGDFEKHLLFAGFAVNAGNAPSQLIVEVIQIDMQEYMRLRRNCGKQGSEIPGSNIVGLFGTFRWTQTAFNCRPPTARGQPILWQE
jgi:hypothetical protein